MKLEDLLDAGVLGRPPARRQHRRDPEGLAALLGLGQVGVGPGRFGHDQPGQRRAQDQPDDEQPPAELGVHGVAAERGGGEAVMREAV